MFRSALPIGAWGEIRTEPFVDGEWSARARYRDADGRLHRIERIADTETAAITSLTGRLQQLSAEARRG